MQANLQILRDKIVMYPPLDIFIYLLEMCRQQQAFFFCAKTLGRKPYNILKRGYTTKLVNYSEPNPSENK